MAVGSTSFALSIFILCAVLSMGLAFVSGRLWERASHSGVAPLVDPGVDGSISM
jgi:hypothetical protein